MTEAGGGVSGTRRLLRRLRDIMAGSGTAQERLERIVRVVASEMVAEVCSAYILRAGEVLELFATEGLRPEAVHRTRLRVGEGIVGVIAATARPLALADAQSHPDFAYRPETGEEIYHSMMGVPIVGWACSPCRTAPSGITRRTRSRRSRLSRWFWRSSPRAANSSAPTSACP